VTPKEYIEDMTCRKVYMEVSKSCQVEMFKVSLVLLIAELIVCQFT